MNDLLIEAQSLQNLLISRATGGINTSNEREFNSEYLRLRTLFTSNMNLKPYIPSFLITCRDLHQFWNLVKAPKFETYAERRKFIYEEFSSLLNFLEFSYNKKQPSDNLANEVIKKFDAAHVENAWQKALERRNTDPEGAITSARTLIESVCKYILDENNIPYDDKQDLQSLYKQTAAALNLAPSQHTEQVFKQILGGCTSIVEGLGSLRNRLSDAHGKGKMGVKPKPHHAALAVNLSGTLSVYLLETLENRKKLLNNPIYGKPLDVKIF